MLFQSISKRVRIKLAKTSIQPRQIGDARRTSVHRREHRLANCWRVIAMFMSKQAQADIDAAAEQTHQPDIDAISGGAAHDAGDDHAVAGVFDSTSAVNF